MLCACWAGWLTCDVLADLRYTKVWNAAAVQTTDVAAALTSGLQKKKPTFEKL